MSTTTAPVGTLRLPRHLSEADRMRVFRRCLEALAEPGTIQRIDAGLDARPSADGIVVAAAPLLALSDLMCPVAALPDDPAAALAIEAVAAQTHAPVVAPGEARFALALTQPEPAALERLGRGTPERPHTACLLFLAVTAIGETDGVALRLSGPGVADVRRVRVAGVAPELFSARAGVMDYPLGIDMMLIDPAGRVLGLPRTTRVEVTA